VGSAALDDHQKWKATAPESHPQAIYLSGSKARALSFWTIFRAKSLLLALHENSGVPMVGAVSTLLRVILAGLPRRIREGSVAFQAQNELA